MMVAPVGRRGASMSQARIFRFGNFPLLLLQVRERFMDRFRPNLQRHGITEQQWRVIRLLFASPPLEPRQIGALTRISSPSLAGILARMERQGLITRQQDSHDKRRQRVQLTARARRIASRMAPAINAIYAQLFEQLGEPLMVQLEGSLEGVLRALGPVAASSAGDAVPRRKATAPAARVRRRR